MNRFEYIFHYVINMEDIFTNLSTYGYIGLFIYSLGGGFFGLVAASTLSYMGSLDITIVLLTAFTSNFIGDIILFWATRTQKQEVFKLFSNHRRKLAISNLFLNPSSFIFWVALPPKCGIAHVLLLISL